MLKSASLIIPTCVLAAVMAMNAPTQTLAHEPSQFTSEFSASKQHYKVQKQHVVRTRHVTKHVKAHKITTHKNKIRILTHKNVNHKIGTGNNTLSHTKTTTIKTNVPHVNIGSVKSLKTVKLSTGPGSLHHKMSMGPAKSNIHVNKFNKKVVIKGGKHKYWNGYKWVTFVGLATLAPIFIGTEFYTPIGFVPLGEPECTGFTPEGCSLNWQEVALEDGGEDVECVAYCPPNVTITDPGTDTGENPPVVIVQGGGGGTNTGGGDGGNGGTTTIATGGGDGTGTGGGNGGTGDGTGTAGGGGTGDGTGAAGGGGTGDGTGAGGGGPGDGTGAGGGGNGGAGAAGAGGDAATGSQTAGSPNAADSATAQARANCEIVVYAEPGLKGMSAPTNEDQPRLDALGWKNEIGSLVVKSCTWDFFTDDDYGGSHMRLKPGSYMQLSADWTKKIASFQCIKAD